MRKYQQLLTLTRVNLRYANPQLTNKLRKKGKNNRVLTNAIIQQYLLSAVIFMGLYAVMMFTVDFFKSPGYFAYYFAIFALLTFAQGLSTIYNVFFESRDLSNYLALPFRQIDVFLAKFLVVIFTVMPFILPLVVLFLLTGWRAGLPLISIVLLSIMLFIFFVIMIFCLCSCFIFSLAKTKLFKRHKHLFATFLLIFSMIVPVIGILLMNSDLAKGQFAEMSLSIFTPFYHAMTNPLSWNTLLHVITLFIVTLLLMMCVRVFILPKLYQQLMASQVITQSTRKAKQGQSLGQVLRVYHQHLVRDPSLIMQTLSSSLLAPLVFLVSFGINSQYNFSQLPLKFIGVFFLVGIVLANMTINQYSFVGNLISLDGENYLFVKSLPLSLKKYLLAKFRFGYVIQLVLSIAVGLLLICLTRVPFAHSLSLLGGICFGVYFVSLYYFHRDYRLLCLNWTNISQLFHRGSGALGMFVWMFASIMFSTVIIVGYVVLLEHFSAIVLNSLLFIVICMIGLGNYHYYQRQFWQRCK